MSPVERDWHPNFINYMNFIVNHPNYKGMPHLRKDDGSIRWVVTGKSAMGQDRENWWRQKGIELGIAIEGRWIAKVAKQNHPTKIKVCQTCGEQKCIEYVYPNKILIKKLNKIEGLENQFQYTDFKSIYEVIEEIISNLGNKGFSELSKLYKIPQNINKTIEDYKSYITASYIERERGNLSPGAMSNAPDRLDGFHSYNICCRSEQDTGRHKENLARYSEDRRAYERWSDGDWKAASWLMPKGQIGTCIICKKVKKVTADHIGPISLGFAHLPIFQPMCNSCNSTKNNRMFLHDVIKLIQLEKEQHTVVSWHSKYIWDKLKTRVNSEKDAIKLGNLMRRAHHSFLELFYIISSENYKDFLMRYLHPEYGYYEQIDFKNLNTSTFSHNGVIKKKGSKTQYHNNAARYVRIAFDSLKNYHKKDNRRIIRDMTPKFYQQVRKILKMLGEDKNFNPKLRALLIKAFQNENDKVKENIIKLALEEFEKNPYNNEEIHNLILNTLQIAAEYLIKEWNNSQNLNKFL